jgi:hypothetical protein
MGNPRSPRRDSCQPLATTLTVVGPKLIASAPKTSNSTERAIFAVSVFLIAEELTEDRALNVTAIKQITDVGRIRARYVFRDNFTFVCVAQLVRNHEPYSRRE